MGKQELKVSGNNSSALDTGKTKQSDLFRTPMPTDYLSRKFVKSNSSVIKQNTIKNSKKYSRLPEKIETVLLYTLNKKYSNTGKEFGWQDIFRAKGNSYHSKHKLKLRDHIHEIGIQKEVTEG